MRRLNDWLKAYLEYTRYSEAPDSFHFWTGVGTIAGALRRKVWFQELYWSWSPNFYIILVAPPGVVQKSTALRNGKKLLQKIKGIRLGPDAITWQALITELEAAKVIAQVPNGQGVPSPLKMSCLTFFSSELGSLIDFTDRQMITILTDLWDGSDDSWRKATKTQTNEAVVNPWLNILAGTTPSFLADTLPRKMIGGGFTSRCVFVYGEKKRHLVAYPSRLVLDMSKVQKLHEDLEHDLADIATIRGEYRMTEDAYKFGEAWYKQHEKQAQTFTDDYAAHMARKQTQLHKLAMVLSAAESSNGEISEDHLTKADLLLSALDNDNKRIFNMIQQTSYTEHVQRLADVVAKAGTILEQEVYRTHFMHALMIHEFRNIVDSAKHAGLVETYVAGNSTVLRPPRGTSSGTP
jgi:hypothetical protein